MEEVPVLVDHANTLAPGLPGLGDPARIEALERTGLLGEGADATLDSFARVAAGLMAAPTAYVTLVTEHRQLSPGAVERDRPGEPDRDVPVTDSICQFQVATDQPLVISDTRTDPLTWLKTPVTNGTLLAYAGVPLRGRGGEVLGSLCVCDGRPRAWQDDRLALLLELGALVSRDIEQRLASREADAVRDVAERLGAELPPLLGDVAALVELAEQDDDPHLQRSAARARRRSLGVGRLAAELQDRQAADGVPAAPGPTTVELRRTVQRAVTGARSATDGADLQLELPAEPLLAACDPVRLERALVHLLVSALHHTALGEPLRIRLSPLGQDRAELTLEAVGALIPAAELGRIIGRFQASTSEQASTVQASAALRLVGGQVLARSGPVSGRSSRQGLAFRAEWQLAPEAGDRVIHLG